VQRNCLTLWSSDGLCPDNTYRRSHSYGHQVSAGLHYTFRLHVRDYATDNPGIDLGGDDEYHPVSEYCDLHSDSYADCSDNQDGDVYADCTNDQDRGFYLRAVVVHNSTSDALRSCCEEWHIFNANTKTTQLAAVGKGQHFMVAHLHNSH